MSKDKDKSVAPDDPTGEDAKTRADAAEKAKLEEDELDEGLEESFPASDAPASTRRSTHD